MTHITTEILGNQVNADTLYFAWGCMGVLLVAGFLLAQGLKADPGTYSARQHFAEGLYKFFRQLCLDQIGPRGKHYTFYIGSLFLFIITAYYAGLIPWKLGSMFDWWPMLPAEHGAHGHHAAGHPWHGASPCADVNVPTALALVSLVIYLLSGTLVGGFKYVQSFLPINFTKKGIKLNLMFLIELMDVAVRPLTLTLRLFANTVAGETLLAVFIGLVAVALPAGIVAFELFVGALQAFLFTILTTVYIGTAVQHAEHLVHDDHH